MKSIAFWQKVFIFTIFFTNDNHDKLFLNINSNDGTLLMVLGIKAKDEKPVMNGTVEQKDKKSAGLRTDKLRTSQTKETISEKAKEMTQRQEDSSNSTLQSELLSVDNKSDVRRAHSWGKHQERPELTKRSSSLDDLTKGIDNEEKVENSKPRSRIQALKSKRPVSLNLDSPKEEGNKLADILDSIKKASDGKQNMAKSSSNTSITSLNDVDLNVNHKDSGLLNPNKSNLQTKSYSYSCLADLKLGEDGKPFLYNFQWGSMVLTWEATGWVTLVRMLTTYQCGSNSNVVPCVLSGWCLLL